MNFGALYETLARLPIKTNPNNAAQNPQSHHTPFSAPSAFNPFVSNLDTVAFEASSPNVANHHFEARSPFQERRDFLPHPPPPRCMRK